MTTNLVADGGYILDAGERTAVKLGPADGIYFGMDEAVYHALPRLSSSGIRNLMISPLDYWTNSYLNPQYEDVKTDAMVIGTAFHRRLLEPDRFKKIYAVRPVPSEYPDAIDGHAALKDRCKELGLKLGGKISDLCDRIIEADPKARLWPVIEQGILEKLKGCTLLKRADMADIERMAAMVLQHQSAAKAISGGQAEVSILWTDPESGVPLKVRVDYLKVKIGMDVKSFSNPYGKPINAAISGNMATNRYGVQAAMYMDGIEAAKAMLRRHKTKVLFGADYIDNGWLVHFAACERHAFAFLFIEQGAVTNVRLREFRSQDAPGAETNLYWRKGREDYRAGVARYVECANKFGFNRPWVEDEPMRAFRDEEFPLYMYDGV
jgi:hypothetical protein